MEDLSPILRCRPTIQWKDVFGLEEAKQKLLEYVVLPIKFPQLFVNRCPPRSILLYGAPGSGKSYIARALVSEIQDTTFLHISACDCVGRYNTSGDMTLRALFEKARAEKPSVILIDDVDMIGRESSENDSDAIRRIRTELSNQLCGPSSRAENEGVAILCTTSVPDRIDAYVRRQLPVRIPIPLPDTKARSEMFKHLLDEGSHCLTEQDIRVLGEKSEGYSGSDIVCMVKDALFEPLRTVRDATHFKKVSGPSNKDPNVTVNDLLTPCNPDDPDAMEMGWEQVSEDKLHVQSDKMEHVLKSLSNSKPSVDADCLAQIDKFTQDFGPA